MTTPVHIGVVLSSGGGRGVFAHTGFLSALEELGIEINVISGCSAGALVGGIYASGTPIETWAETIATVPTHEYWNPNPWPRVFWNLIARREEGYSGISDSHTPIEFIRRNLSAKHFEDCQIPFYSLAMNINKKKKTIFCRGELAPRIMASAAMPLLYQPVKIDDEWYGDGAIIELAPVESICCRHHLDVLIIHHAGIHPNNSRPMSLIETLYLQRYPSHSTYLSEQPLSFHQCSNGCGVHIISLNPELPNLSWPINEGGNDITMAAKSQTLSLLRPHLHILKSRKYFNDTQSIDVPMEAVIA